MEQPNRERSPYQLHQTAMEIADMALKVRTNGDVERAKQLTVQSLELEERAARMLGTNSEPTRSILFRSAATLAHEAGQDDRALNLIDAGFQGNPPQEIRVELEELRDSLTSS